MFERILITGSSGFLGRHLRPILEERYGRDRVICVNSSHYDLMDRAAAERMFEDIKPDAVVHLAAYSGGIGANRRYPADFYYQNTMLTATVFDAAARHNVRKFLYPMGGCAYPANARSPIDEGQLWQGFPSPESAGYSTAKMMGVVAAQSYRTQYGLNATVVIPGNMYGEYDNFSAENSHVIPALIRRYYEARFTGTREVVAWGSGKPERDFVYAGDVAATFPFFLESFDEVGPVNISSGTCTTIRALTEAIARHTGYEGAVTWDTSKPDGHMIKIFDTSRLRGLGLSCDTPLDDGLARTVAWFAANYGTRGDGLRL